MGCLWICLWIDKTGNWTARTEKRKKYYREGEMFKCQVRWSRGQYRWRGKGEEREDSGKKNRRQAVLEERFDIVGFLAFFSYSLLTTILRRAAVTRGERANQNGLQNTLLVYEILADEGRMLSLALTLPLPPSHSALLSWLSTDLRNSISSYRAFPIHQN